ncbi:MAG: hypothetical protein SVY10_16895 [Thermodesulfobacteriota bacterium]|nr:hypothetical protein [Thermodesulfobacteriota bacterium]
MTHEKGPHLTEDQLIRAVVDGDDLSRSLQDHLLECEFCCAEKERLEYQLSRLGRMAKSLTPLPGKRVKLPAETSSSKTWSQAWLRRSFLAAGVAAAMTITLMWWRTPNTISPNGDKAQWTWEIFQEEYSLPLTYFDIAGESISGINEEFMDFVIPDIQNEAIQKDKRKEMNYVT